MWTAFRERADRFACSIHYGTMNGIFSGKSGNVFDPQGGVNRAEFATVLMQYDGDGE